MSTTLYREYSQRELDSEYDNRRKVSEEYFLALSARLAKRSHDARQTWRCRLDITYGTAPAERLDIFEPDSNLSTVIFFHGGYWRVNDKKDFAYVANGLLPHGIKLVVPGYGLIPTVTMDQLIDQCRRAVAWTFHNIVRQVPSPVRICLAGHSAGAHIVAMMLTTDWSAYDLPRDFVGCAIGISGVYELEPIRLSFLNSTLKLTAVDVERNSPLRLPPRQTPPFLLAIGEREGAEFLRQSEDLCTAWGRYGYNLERKVLKDANHYSAREQLDDPCSEIVMLMVDRMANQ